MNFGPIELPDGSLVEKEYLYKAKMALRAVIGRTKVSIFKLLFYL